MVKYLSFFTVRVNLFVGAFWVIVMAEIIREPGFHPIALALCALCMAICDWLLDRIFRWFGIPTDNG